MKRAFPILPFAISPLFLAAAIGTASMVRADDGLPHPGFEVMVVTDATAAAMLASSN